MDHLARRFLEGDTENRDLYINGILLKDRTSLESLNKKFNDYLFRISLCSYIKKSIVFASIDLREKESTIREKEGLYLNTLDENFDEEKINTIPDASVNFEEEIYVDKEYLDLCEIFTDRNILKAIHNLTERQKQIVYECIVKDKKDHLVAKELGISKQSVNKIKNTALNKLRKQIGGE